ncbi:hypothetical protein BGZ73_001593, partial [Actinomortierella ambigua]
SKTGTRPILLPPLHQPADRSNSHLPTRSVRRRSTMRSGQRPYANYWFTISFPTPPSNPRNSKKSSPLLSQLLVLTTLRVLPTTRWLL